MVPVQQIVFSSARESLFAVNAVKVVRERFPGVPPLLQAPPVPAT